MGTLTLKEIITNDILPEVETPVQYVNGEHNSVVKNHAEVDVTFALAFPDTYAVGMSHTGLLLLYSILNARDDVACERVFAPWLDMADKLRQASLPLYTLESFTPLGEFDILGFSFQYEMCYTNVLTMLDLAGIPLRSEARDDDHPLIIAGGPCAFSPEPMADFVDLFILGDGEEVLGELIDVYKELVKGENRTRREFLIEAVKRVKGLYAPSLYGVTYNDDGTIAAIEPTVSDLPDKIERAYVTDLDAAQYMEAPVVPSAKVVQDRLAVEIMRGCTQGCRFCSAGIHKRPTRTRSRKKIRQLAELGYRATGHNEISLMSLSSGDYPEIKKLIAELSSAFQSRDVNMALPSLRVDEQLTELPALLSVVRKSGLTVAPEAATERLRNVMNKKLDEEDLYQGVEQAYREGWKLIKLYFMVGLPTETGEDIDGIVAMAHRVSDARKRVRKDASSVNVAIAPFVPKAHTPFQWEAMASVDQLQEIRERIYSKIRRKKVRIKFHNTRRSFLEAVFSRGDRRLGAVLETAWKKGCSFDAWDEQFKYDEWISAFEEEGIDPAFYANRLRESDEVLPWDHLSAGVTKDFLLRERERAENGEISPDCRTGPCLGCGACDRAVSHAQV